MILGGDEFGRSQHGNNNAYCQDNDVSWLDWTRARQHADLLEFFRKAIAFTRRFPILQRRQFRLGKDRDDDGVPDLAWFGTDPGGPRWNDPGARALCYQLDSSEDGAKLAVGRLFFILNAQPEAQWVNLPPLDHSLGWYRAIDTSLPSGMDFADEGKEIRIDPADHYIANPRSSVVLLAH